MRILVVDDHAMFAESVKLLLGTRHQISTALTGADAIQKLTTEPPALILLDNELPDIDGITLLKVVRAVQNPPPVLIVSGSDNINLVEAAREHGAAGFLHKSLSAESLKRAVERAGSGRFVWPDVSSEADSLPVSLPVSTNTETPGRRFNGSNGVMESAASSPFNRHVVEQLGITGRQLDVLGLLIGGDSNKLIARRLGIAESTVKTHVKTLYRLLGVGNRVACRNRAVELAIIED